MGQDTFVPLAEFDASQVETHGLRMDHVEYHERPATDRASCVEGGWDGLDGMKNFDRSQMEHVVRTTRATALAAFTLSFIAIMIVVIWPFVNSIVLGHNYNLMVAMNHTLQHDHKEVNHLSPNVRAMQDYLVAQVFEPCTSAKCETDRITQMFGGKLPRRYQHYLLDAVAYQQQQQQQFEQESD